LEITQEELEAKYDEIGNLRLLAEVLGVSKTTLHKYLRHKTKDTKPWSSVKQGEPSRNIDYLRYKYRKAVIESFERAMLAKKTWTDINGRTIPREAMASIYVEPPRKIIPIIPVYAMLKGTDQTVIFMFHPDVPWVSHQQEEHSSDEEILDSFDLAPST
jgi:hypothetical protein